MRKMVTDSSIVGRRSVLKGIGAAALATTVLGGTAAAHPQFPHNNRNTTTTFGEGVDVVGDSHEDIWTFATTNRNGRPMMMGVWMTRGAFESVTASPAPVHYHLDMPAVANVNFTFAGVDWNPQGHPPENVWTVPHFDFHFYLMDEADVAAIPFGVPTYSIPAEMTPPGYVTEDALGAPSRTVIPAMGEHLIDTANPTPPYTYIYGAYDPAIDPTDPGPLLGYVDFATGDEYPPTADPADLPPSAVPLYLLTSGDGVGELTFVEPMVTAAYLSSLVDGDGELRQSVPTPAVFPAAGYYPTEYVVRYYGRKDAFLVTLEEFEWFDAPVPGGLIA